MNNMMYMLSLAIYKILENPHGFQWSMQGFGMLRCYLSRDVRLHLWSHDHRATSNIHSHPWHFESRIISGAMQDHRYRLVFGDETHLMQEIQCGPGGCVRDEPRPASLKFDGTWTVYPGDFYQHNKEDLHESFPSDGCVSIIHRIFEGDTENAKVAVPIGSEFVFIEPRPATSDEVNDIASKCLRLWDGPRPCKERSAL